MKHLLRVGAGLISLATGHIVRLGLNYRFATGKVPAPVVTKY